MAYDTREGKEPRGPTCIEHQVNEWEWGGKVEENSNLITKISHLDSRESNINRGILGAAPSEGRKLHLMLCCVGGAREAPLKGGKARHTCYKSPACNHQSERGRGRK